jgi:adenylylsulfate kinase-like enzyme
VHCGGCPTVPRSGVAEDPRIIARRPMLIILGGLPGTGKTVIARELARQLGAIYLRIDSIEQVIRDFRSDTPFDEAGYCIGSRSQRIISA